MARRQLTRQLVRAACGGGSSSPSQQLRSFALHEHHFGNISSSKHLSATPSDFHSHLCQKIRHAQERVILASLYIGVGSGSELGEMSTSKDHHYCKEDEFLQSLYFAASNKEIKQMQIILDANRAMRKVSFTNKRNAGQSHDSNQGSSLSTNSADAVLSTLKPFLERIEGDNHSKNSNNGLFLFPVNDQRLCTILPSPLDEVAGVFHIKAYLVDDELILSGANLSEEYFSNRLDRYMLFTDGGGGLVDFYADLCDTLCSYAIKYDGQPPLLSTQSFDSTRKQHLESSLARLFVDETQTILPGACSHSDALDPVAYAIPTFQMPNSILGRPFQFQSDNDASRDLLLAAVESDQDMSVRLSSAYLNLTPRLRSVLTMFGNKRGGGAPYVLTAGAMSHGFAPKKQTKSKQNNVGIVDKIKSSIPEAFLTLVKEASQSIIACGGKVLLYERQGWTFHAKGVWITANDTNTSRQELINDPTSVVSTIIGSGNYGARSEDLDVESNCVIVFNEQSKGEPIQQSVANDWNNMCEHSTVTEDLDFRDDVNNLTNIVVQFMKKFL
ncbi:CDP-diacylglycerol--glycerol-3-phosphate 3-phosphatidyltransferase [Skeletonema marinoi]|uniref:CDP-diacylglycerol--glycerol-3-phosphate 3-phosphatidyltransferase n=1 Tax=Skeletonema marinoi TaxID=267567 RepID=A0AAD9DDR3_9STRA|nr:CDP-diacylglycerol--glycerol-3-phosphate 3-phosphatidyltransferase [Skeletonema marinoi]